MAMTLLYGASSGALHAVSGPDHLLSLAPAAMAERGRSFRIGLNWGIGHALGTLALCVPLVLLSGLVELHAFAAWGDRLAGLALILTSFISLRSLRHVHAAHEAEQRSALLVGCIHGATGAGSLLLVLPVLISGSATHSLLFLAAFSIGSTFAMAGLTHMLARLGERLAPALVRKTQSVLTAGALALGVGWLLYAL